MIKSPHPQVRQGAPIPSFDGQYYPRLTQQFLLTVIFGGETGWVDDPIPRFPTTPYLESLKALGTSTVWRPSCELPVQIL